MAIIINATVESAFKVLHDHELLQYLKENILSGYGGEFAIGGVFHVADKKGQEYIYNKWGTVAPLLERIFCSLQKQDEEEQEKQQPLPPLLQASILAKAPKSIVLDIIQRFDDSILIRDNLNRLPITVALKEEQLSLVISSSGGGSDSGSDKGEIIKHIMEAMAKAQARPIVHIAAEYGLKWSNNYSMKELINLNVEEVISGYDRSTGLSPFMLAAMGSNHDCRYNNTFDNFSSDLSSIYGMMKMSPIVCCNGEQYPQNQSIAKKRKRI